MSERRDFSDGRRGGRTHGECGRGEELVAYLYGEAGPEAERMFGAHLRSCASCREEASAFRVVREGLGRWREEVLSAAPPFEVAPALLATPAEASAPALRSDAAPARRRSALGALREFFSLTPLWLKAGGAFAAVAVCALAALALARVEVRWDERGFAIDAGGAARVVERRVEVQAPGTYTERQLEEIADARVRAALEEQLAAMKTQEASAAAGVAAPKNVPVNVPVRAERQPRRNAKAPVSRDDSVRARDEFPQEDNLPGLYDLLRAAN